MEYQHTQWGRLGVPVFLLFALIAIVSIFADEETSPWVSAAIIAAMLALLGLVLAFSRLEVTVSGDRVVAAFGFGRPHRVIDLEDVAAVRQVRNQWWYGWGVRKIPGGWMYNVWGLDAVELELTSGNTFRIGTDDPENFFGVLSVLLAS